MEKQPVEPVMESWGGSTTYDDPGAANGCVLKWFLGGSKEDAGERYFAVPCSSSGWVRRDEVPH
ncbi:MAG: hypothetical protein WBQ29_07685, partial [Isosphaeraceae bacterium]